jgi:hypothetical protein
MFYTLFILIVASFSLFIGYVLGKDKQKKSMDLYFKNLAKYMTPEAKTAMLKAMDDYTDDLKKMKEMLSADN